MITAMHNTWICVPELTDVKNPDTRAYGGSRSG
jgi:hypothetical protein